MTTPEGVVTAYTWDGLQQLLSVTDGRNNTTSFVYTGSVGNNVQRLAAIQKPAGGVVNFVYDSATVCCPGSRTKTGI